MGTCISSARRVATPSLPSASPPSVSSSSSSSSSASAGPQGAAPLPSAPYSAPASPHPPGSAAPAHPPEHPALKHQSTPCLDLAMDIPASAPTGSSSAPQQQPNLANAGAQQLTKQIAQLSLNDDATQGDRLSDASSLDSNSLNRLQSEKKRQQ
eukprot:GHVT01099103.1.p1 GENE.GHVT01099103.1~~GHVT01099103.1.p1  ORF type:complete len:154 (+),score=48.76 GHVT01099103.1:691-1152(+)